MSRLSKGRHLIGTLLITAAVGATAASNPINENYVQLSAADWEAVCTSGTTAGGCFGNVGSIGYKKLERLCGYPAYQLSVLVQDVAKSVYIRKYGPSGEPAENPGRYTFSTAGLPTPTTAVCQIFTPRGTTIPSLRVGAGDNVIFQFSTSYANPAAKSGATGTSQYSLVNSYANQPLNESPPVDVYVMCYGVKATGGTRPYSLEGISLT